MQPVNFNKHYYVSFDVHFINVINLPNPVSFNLQFIKDSKVDFEDDKQTENLLKRTFQNLKFQFNRDLYLYET